MLKFLHIKLSSFEMVFIIILINMKNRFKLLKICTNIKFINIVFINSYIITLLFRNLLKSCKNEVEKFLIKNNNFSLLYEMKFYYHILYSRHKFYFMKTYQHYPQFINIVVIITFNYVIFAL
jgi:hypothetical protein